MSAREPINVENLTEGDMVDLQGDEYADVAGNAFEDLHFYEYAIVLSIEQETSACVRVDFDHESYGFPTGHRLDRITA